MGTQSRQQASEEAVTRAHGVGGGVRRETECTWDSLTELQGESANFLQEIIEQTSVTLKPRSQY